MPILILRRLYVSNFCC